MSRSLSAEPSPGTNIAAGSCLLPPCTISSSSSRLALLFELLDVQ